MNRSYRYNIVSLNMPNQVFLLLETMVDEDKIKIVKNEKIFGKQKEKWLWKWATLSDKYVKNAPNEYTNSHVEKPNKWEINWWKLNEISSSVYELVFKLDAIFITRALKHPFKYDENSFDKHLHIPNYVWKHCIQTIWLISKQDIQIRQPSIHPFPH